MAKKLVAGVGINDADYVVNVQETVGYVDGKRKRRTVWQCSFYRTWVNMLGRCYSSTVQNVNPTYVGCSVVEEWKTFSVFKAWMETQAWEGNQLDKDLLTPGNKVYGPEHCVFVSQAVNLFMTEGTAIRGEWPIGVSWDKRRRKFLACCGTNPSRGGRLGIFSCPNQAHQAWLKRKRELAHELAALQTDPRVAKALVDRYAVDVYTPLHEEG